MNIAVFARMQLSGAFDSHATAAAAKEALIGWGGAFGLKALNGEVWRFFSAIFVHTGVKHLVGSLCALFLVSPFLISVLGTVPTALIYLACGWMGNVAAAITDPDAVVVGASGAIFGLYGALLSVFASGRFGGHSETDQRQLKRAIWLSLPLSLLTSSLPATSLIAAYAGGMVSGCLLGYCLTRKTFVARYGLATASLAAALLGIFFVTAVTQGTRGKTFRMAVNPKPTSTEPHLGTPAYQKVIRQYGDIHAKVAAAMLRIHDGQFSDAGLKRLLTGEAVPTLGDGIIRLKALPQSQDRETANLIEAATAYLELERGYYASLAKNTEGMKGAERLRLAYDREVGRLSGNWKDVQSRLSARAPGAVP